MNTTIHYLTQEELKQISPKRDKVLILLAYSYGLRASEVGLLRQENKESVISTVSSTP